MPYWRATIKKGEKLFIAVSDISKRPFHEAYVDTYFIYVG